MPTELTTRRFQGFLRNSRNELMKNTVFRVTVIDFTGASGTLVVPYDVSIKTGADGKYDFEIPVLSEGDVYVRFTFEPNRKQLERLVSAGAPTSIDQLLVSGLPVTSSIQSYILSQLALIPTLPQGGSSNDFLRGGANGAEWASFNDEVLNAEIIYSGDEDSSGFEDGDTFSEFAVKTKSRFDALFPAGGAATKFWAESGDFLEVDLAGLATESYVTNSINNLVNAAPGALDTLNELAAALGDDANFAATTATAIGLKAPKLNPEFEGVARFADGSAAAPAISNPNFSTTGLFWAAGKLGFSINGKNFVSFHDSSSSFQSKGFLRVDGTLGDTGGADSGVVVNITSLGSAQALNGGSSAMEVVLRGGTGVSTRSLATFNARCEAQSLLTTYVIDVFNDGGTVLVDGVGYTVGASVGIRGGAKDSGTGAAGVVGYATGTTNPDPYHVGVYGFARHGVTARAGGYFWLKEMPSEVIFPDGWNESAALIANNDDTTDDILILMDNGVPVFRVADGGAITFAGSSFAGLTKAMVGLGSADDTSDLLKPISNDTQDALDLKENSVNKSTDGTFAANSDILFPSQKAAKTYVDTKVAALVDSSPATLDTLNELAAALGDEPNFATTVSTTIGTKLAKASNLSDLTDAAAARINIGFGNVDNTSDAAKNAAVAVLTNKTISGADNTLSNIAQSSVTGLEAEISSAKQVFINTSFTAGQPVAGATTNYLAPGAIGGNNNLNATESSRQSVIPAAGILGNFYVRTTTQQPANGALTVTIRIEGADTQIVITIPADGAAGVYSDTTHTHPVSLNDRISVKCANTAATASASIISLAVILQKS